MNNKLGFILPRIMGAAVIAGLGAMALFIIFKLLIGLAVVGSIGFLVMKAIRRHRGHYGQQQYGMMPYRNDFGRMKAEAPSPFGMGQMHQMQRTSGIIPIN